MKNLEIIVRHYLSQILRLDPLEIDLSKPLAQGLGLSSLDIVLFITHTCKEADIPMTLLTEDDISTVRTGNDFLQMLLKKQTVVG